jgi:hypothetical protein
MNTLVAGEVGAIARLNAEGRHRAQVQSCRAESAVRRSPKQGLIRHGPATCTAARDLPGYTPNVAVPGLRRYG